MAPRERPRCRRALLCRRLCAGPTRGLSGAVVETAWKVLGSHTLMESYGDRRLSGGIPVTEIWEWRQQGRSD
jgi:hypothetical protein